MGAVTFAGPKNHGYGRSVQEAACLAINAGSDLALGGEFAPHLGACVAKGRVQPERVEQALTRTLTALFRLGWFDTLGARARGQPDPVPYNRVSMAQVASPAHRSLARRAARESLVLLKNAGGRTLPLACATGGLRRVALVGPTATFSGSARSSYAGNYAPCLASPTAKRFSADPRCHVVSLREALRSAARKHGFRLTYARGSDVNRVDGLRIPRAVASAAGADVIIAAVGLDSGGPGCSEAEANDRGRGIHSIAPTLDLPGSQLALLQVRMAAAVVCVPPRVHCTVATSPSIDRHSVLHTRRRPSSSSCSTGARSPPRGRTRTRTPCSR